MSILTIERTGYVKGLRLFHVVFKNRIGVYVLAEGESVVRHRLRGEEPDNIKCLTVSPLFLHRNKYVVRVGKFGATVYEKPDNYNAGDMIPDKNRIMQHWFENAMCEELIRFVS